MIRFLSIESGYKMLSLKLSDCVTECIKGARYIHSLDDWGIINHIKAIMETNSMSIIPVFNENRELIYFAYEEDINSELEMVLEGLERGNAAIFLEDIYPQMNRGGVKIYDFNEWAVRFYQILKKYKIPVEVSGEKWRTLFPEDAKFKLDVSEENIMTIWAEGTSRFLDLTNQSCEQGWWFLHSIGIQNHIWITEKYVKKYKSMGINVLTSYFPRFLPRLTLEEEYRSKMNVFMGGPRQLWEKENTRQQLCKVYGKEITYQEWCAVSNERESKYIYIDGKAIETKVYGDAGNKVYIVGPCIVRGTTSMRDDETLGACLWEQLKINAMPYSVVCVVFDMHEFTAYEKFFEYLTLTENDIVLVINHRDVKDYIKYTNDIFVESIFEKRTEDWFYDIPIHTNFTGNQQIASFIMEQYLLPITKKATISPKYLQFGKRMLRGKESRMLNLYLEKIKEESKLTNKGMKIGSIVMNCNPMTKGHLYLIEESRKKVDYLYVFIVEENKSVFQFEERFSLVKKETKKMDNVIVVPSGKFVLSALTLPLYFEKSEKKDAELDASVDLGIFGEYIAPELGITERFVGEERADLVTRQYNEQMKILLPSYGIEVTEIPRRCVDGEPISASKVRELLQREEWEQIKLYVTEDVLNYLVGRSSRKMEKSF